MGLLEVWYYRYSNQEPSTVRLVESRYSAEQCAIFDLCIVTCSRKREILRIGATSTFTLFHTPYIHAPPSAISGLVLFRHARMRDLPVTFPQAIYWEYRELPCFGGAGEHPVFRHKRNPTRSQG